MSDGTSIYLASLKLADPIGAFAKGAQLSAQLQEIQMKAAQNSFNNVMDGISMAQKQRQLGVQNDQNQQELNLRREDMTSRAAIAREGMASRERAAALRSGSGASYTPAGVYGAEMAQAPPEGAPDLGPDRSEMGNGVNFMAAAPPDAIAPQPEGPPTPGEQALGAAGNQGQTDLGAGVNFMASRPPDVGPPAERNQPQPGMVDPSIFKPISIADGRGNVTQIAENDGVKLQRKINEKTGVATNWSKLPGGEAAVAKSTGLPPGAVVRSDKKVDWNGQTWTQEGVTMSTKGVPSVRLKAVGSDDTLFSGDAEEVKRKRDIYDQAGFKVGVTVNKDGNASFRLTDKTEVKPGSAAAWGKSLTGKPKEIFIDMMEQVVSPSDRAKVAAVGNTPVDGEGKPFPVNLTKEQEADTEFKAAWETAWKDAGQRMTDADWQSGYEKARSGYAEQVAKKLNVLNTGSPKWTSITAADVLAKLAGLKGDNAAPVAAAPAQEEVFVEEDLTAPPTLFPTDGRGQPTAAANPTAPAPVVPAAVVKRPAPSGMPAATAKRLGYAL